MSTKKRKLGLPMRGDLFSPQPAAQEKTPAMDMPNHKLHRKGQATSEAAITRHAGGARGRAEVVYRALQGRGLWGAIPEDFVRELAMELLDVRRAFSTLKNKKLIEPQGIDRMNDKGNKCQVWMVRQ